MGRTPQPSGESFCALWPAWLPDGSRIAFNSDRDGNSDIYGMNADGSGQTDITDSPAEDGTPAWSPDRRPDRFLVRSALGQSGLARQP